MITKEPDSAVRSIHGQTPYQFWERTENRAHSYVVGKNTVWSGGVIRVGGMRRIDGFILFPSEQDVDVRVGAVEGPLIRVWFQRKSDDSEVISQDLHWVIWGEKEAG